MRPTIATRRLKVRSDRVGVHAFDRATGLNVLFDEFAVSEQDWAAAPRHLAIALTNAPWLVRTSNVLDVSRPTGEV